MDETLIQLKALHECFDAEQAGAWALAALPLLRHALPTLSSHSLLAQEGFSEAVMGLRDQVIGFQEADPEAAAFELCDRLADVLDFIND